MNLESYLVLDHCALSKGTFLKNNFMILLGDLYIVKTGEIKIEKELKTGTGIVLGFAVEKIKLCMYVVT